MKLKNKVAVITGGNSGIGFGIAREFAAEGAVRTIAGRNEETLKSSVAVLGDQTNMFAETEQKFGKIEILIVNARGAIGEGTAGNMADVTEETFDKIMDLNLKSVFFYRSESTTALERWCLCGDGRVDTSISKGL